MPALQWLRQAAHHCVGEASVDWSLTSEWLIWPAACAKVKCSYKGRATMINPLSAVGGINALHTAVQAIRSAIGIIADIRSAGGKANKQQEEAIDTAITLANQNAAIAEAQLALSFGYELCKCEFPPTPMRTVGRHIKATAHGKKEGDPVYECPKCGYNTAGRDDYERLASKKLTTNS
jgi:hypothetical protein